MTIALATSLISDDIYQRYLQALLAGDRPQCTTIVQELIASGVAIKSLYLQLFQRSLYHVGELWEHQKISVAVEHMATAITERLLTLIQAQVFSGAVRDKTMIVACVAEEHHQIGARMVADLCELRGWRGQFLGANTPLPDLLRLIEAQQPTVLGLSLSIYFNLPMLLKALDAISKVAPTLPIWVGGQAFKWGGLSAIQAYPQVAYIASHEQLEQRMLIHES